MNDYIAYCGLNCETCEARIATIKNDNDLREKVAKKWSKLNNIVITAEMINCVGCRILGAKTEFSDKLCPIKQCALKSECSTCGNCVKLDNCETVKMIISNNKKAYENLKSR